MWTEDNPVLGPYLLRKEILRDGYGILYHAVEESSKSDILLKAISPDISNLENFIVRFELLKGIAREIKHPHILRIHSLDSDRNVYYIAKEYPSQLLTLKNFNSDDSPSRYRSMETIFSNISEAMAYLLKFKNTFYRSGILPEHLTEDSVFVCQGKKGLEAKLDGFLEPFLFFGDETFSSLKYRMHRALEQNTDPYAQEFFFSPASRRGTPVLEQHCIQQLGGLMYHYIGRQEPRGYFPPLCHLDPKLDPIWDEISGACFSQATIDEVLALFKKLKEKNGQLSVLEKEVSSTDIPDGMGLIAFDDKVELGWDQGEPRESPRFKARIRPFLMDITPVTCADFAQFMPTYQRSAYSAGETCPATLVSWQMAKAYCRWRGEKEGLGPNAYRLPTEYEWEAACRGCHGDQYPWGDCPDPKRLHAGQNSDCGTVPVKTFPSGRFGLEGMLGNVWEWTESRYKPHPFSKASSERGYKQKAYVVKGGCWYTASEACRGSMRMAFKPYERRSYVGFRCVRQLG